MNEASPFLPSGAAILHIFSRKRCLPYLSLRLLSAQAWQIAMSV
jgi:hypothetical protein